MKEENKPILFMLMSTLSLSVTGLLAKQLSDDLSVAMFSFLRFFTPALVLLVMLRFRSLKLPTIDTIKPILLEQNPGTCIVLDDAPDSPIHKYLQKFLIKYLRTGRHKKIGVSSIQHNVRGGKWTSQSLSM